MNRHNYARNAIGILSLITASDAMGDQNEPRLFRCVEIANDSTVVRIEEEITNASVIQAFASAIDTASVVKARYAKFEPNREMWLVCRSRPASMSFVFFPNFTLPATFWMFSADTTNLPDRLMRGGRIGIGNPMQEKGEGRLIPSALLDAVRRLRRTEAANAMESQSKNAKNRQHPKQQVR